MKNLMQKLGKIWRNPVKCYFEKGVIICDDCQHLIPIHDLEEFSFTQCPRCGATNFVPMQVGDFMLFRPIGAGGNASVYKAYLRDESNEVFAVKVLWNETEKAIKAFQMEATIHNSVTDHPNIADFVEFDYDNNVYYYAMEMVLGKDLKHIVENERKLTEYQTFYVAAQLVSALRHILNHGFLYRDLNASNVLLTKTNKAYLIDFGLALPIDKAFADHSQKTRTIEGTPEFLPPERIYRTGEDERSVIYSLGMLMYYMLEGETFIKSHSVMGYIRRQVSDLRLAITPSMMRDFAENTARIISKAVKLDVDDRFNSLAEMETVILKHLSYLESIEEFRNLQELAELEAWKNRPDKHLM